MQQPTRAAALLLCWLGVAAANEGAAAPDRPESQQEYWAQFDRRDWTQAVAEANRLVEAARQEAAEKPFALAEALALLGNAHLGGGDHVNAEAAYAEALRIVQQHDGSTSERLLDPLRGLGYTLSASGRHDEAVPYLDTALILARRNYGLFDTSQQGLLRQLAASLTKIGRAPEAERHMQYLLRVGERNYGPDDPQLAPIMCQVGEWYMQTGAAGLAREQFREAIELVTRKLGRSHIAAVEPLRGLARTFTHELFLSTLGFRAPEEPVLSDADGSSNESRSHNPRYIDSEGEKALERAIKIIESQPAPPPETYAQTLIQLGDWQMIKEQHERALPLYRRAAAVLATLDAAAPQEGGTPAPLLSFPVRVYYAKPWLATRNLTLPDDLVNETFVQVEFTVTSEGLVADERVLEQNGGSRQSSETLEAIRDARFRPRFVDGEPVDTPGVTFREVFRTRKPTGGDAKS